MLTTHRLSRPFNSDDFQWPVYIVCPYNMSGRRRRSPLSYDGWAARTAQSCPAHCAAYLRTYLACRIVRLHNRDNIRLIGENYRHVYYNDDERLKFLNQQILQESFIFYLFYSITLPSSFINSFQFIRVLCRLLLLFTSFQFWVADCEKISLCFERKLWHALYNIYISK